MIRKIQKENKTYKKEDYMEEMEEIIEDTLDLVENFNLDAKKSRSIVYLESINDGRSFQFKYNLNGDKFIKTELYEKGNAFIYISDFAYNRIDKIAKRLGHNVEWNNTESIGWLSI